MSDKARPCMDNNRLIVVSETRGDFDLAMQLAFRQHSLCAGWSIWKPKRSEYDKDRPEEMLGVCAKEFLVFHWCKPDSDSGVIPFPVPVEVETATAFAWEWLEKQDYGQEPDHDGSNTEGFILLNDPWGQVNGQYHAIIAIGPAWAMQGK